MGDRELNLLKAIAEIGKLPSTRIRGLSGFYDTEAVGEPQDDFLNAVMAVETELSPRRLLESLQKIESDIFRRVRTVRWSPRAMDLDILFYGNSIIHEDDLTIPHPLLHERRFVLQPLQEIAPDFVHPRLHKTVTELLREVAGSERVTRID